MVGGVGGGGDFWFGVWCGVVVVGCKLRVRSVAEIDARDRELSDVIKCFGARRYFFPT
jgi:hypothetical protein